MTTKGIMWETPFIRALYSVIPKPGLEDSSLPLASALASWVNVDAFSADDNCIGILDVRGREVTLQADGAVRFNLDVITRLRGGSFEVFCRHIGAGDTGRAGRYRKDERVLLLSVIPPI